MSCLAIRWSWPSLPPFVGRLGDSAEAGERARRSALSSDVVISRRMEQVLRESLESSAGVVVVGPRRIGKTTLATKVARDWSSGSRYLDLERPADLETAIRDGCSFLRQPAGKLVILDEVQELPGLFEILRGVIDDNRAAGFRHGQFLLLASASPDLVHVSSERLAGRVAKLDLSGIDAAEAAAAGIGGDRLWLRGGYPDSLLANSDSDSLAWRVDLIRSCLGRDAQTFATRGEAEALRRTWTTLAHHSGEVLNASRLAAGIGSDGTTVDRHIDLLVGLGLVRRLLPWPGSAGHGLIDMPRIFIRDTGLLHALLDIGDLLDLLGHPVAGRSFETLAVESLASAAEPRLHPYHFLTTTGDGIDLLLVHDGRPIVAIEVGRSTRSAVSAGFKRCANLLDVPNRFVAVPGGGELEACDAQPVTLPDGTQVAGLSQLTSLVANGSLAP